jgi:flagellar export protein FliJ
MSRARRLQTLARLAGMVERNARLALARSTTELQRREAQQTQLESFDAEYANAWIEAGHSGLRGREVVALGAFRTSLGRTLDAQRAAVRQAGEARTLDAARWRVLRERLRVFGELADRAAEQEERARDKRAQRFLDELAARPRTESG